ncbi:hypothetical protein DL93DRAFT_447894 [Clavulina sp. PMI_390]|nr:hypothetical protein DL93DRAFT_447894 [Clavulina sp. PMI_390]
MAAIMTTPDRHASNVSPLLRRPSSRPALPFSTPISDRSYRDTSPMARRSPAGSPLRRPHGGVPVPQPISLSVGPTRRPAGELKRSRPSISSKIPHDPSLPQFGASKRDESPQFTIPAIRPAQLSPHDLNAPKAKRRSVEFTQPPPIPRLVLSPADPKPKSRTMLAARLPAPVFTDISRPELRRANTQPNGMRVDFAAPADGVSRSSDSMTRLSLSEADFNFPDDAARLFGSPRPIDSTWPNHQRIGSSEKRSKRLSLPKPLMDVFHDGSSSPSAAVTPTKTPSRRHLSQPPIIISESSPMPSGLEHIFDSAVKSRADSLPDFVLPVQRGIAKKPSNIADNRALTLPKAAGSKASRLSERLRPRELPNFSFDAADLSPDDADASFASMTSLGSPVRDPTVTLPSDPSFMDFVSGIDEHSSSSIGPFHRATSPDIPMVTPGIMPSFAAGWPGIPPPAFDAADSSDDEVAADDVDMDTSLFATLKAKQSGRASMPAGSRHMPDTPVKHAPRASMPAQLRPWQSAIKPNKASSSKCAHHFSSTLRTSTNNLTLLSSVGGAPRKSLPAKFTPFLGRKTFGVDSPDSDRSPEVATRSPSPTLRTRGAVGAIRHAASSAELRKLPRPSLGFKVPELSPAAGPSSGLGLFQAASPAKSTNNDLLSGMGISRRRADLMRRTSSSAWSISSESSSEGGLNTPSRKNNSTGEGFHDLTVAFTC